MSMFAQTVTYSAAPVHKVREVQFGIMSPEEIKAYSVAKIEHSEVMDESGYRPRVGGLMDPRMGTIDRNFKCQTCGEGPGDCPGHFGHIELARPVYHAGFLVKVKKILECICVNCGKLKADLGDDIFRTLVKRADNPKRRLQVVWEYCKGKMLCESDDMKEEEEDPEKPQRPSHGGCGHIQPLIRKDGLKLFLVYKKRKGDDDDEDIKMAQPEKRLLTAAEAHSILRKIPASDLRIMGLSERYARPEWMILSVIPVPPPQVRPSIMSDSLRSEDDLTYKLADILKTSATLRKHDAEGAPAHVVSEIEQLLQFHVATYMDNEIAGQPRAMQKSGRPVKAIRSRLKGKEGRLRGNLMGKRVDFSARTVITGDPNIALDEVGVPRSIAMTLTYPERVTKYNIERLTELIRNGPLDYPGARYIIRDTGERIDLRYKRGDVSLQIGWVVERHLRDGDYVLFNRQPSLHKMSMMSHRVRVMPYSTFRLNLSVTPPYNADFDGDEMNLHVPQSEETRAELKEIAWVPRQIVSPQANKPVMGIVQDTLAGIYKMTQRDIFLDWPIVQNILLWVPGWDGSIPHPCVIKPKPLWSGKQILALVIPQGINLANGNLSNGNPINDDALLIENGEVMMGIFNKGAVGSSAGGLIHVVFRERGPEVTRDMIGGIQTVVNYWLFHNGFSIGIGDTVPDKPTEKFIMANIEQAKEEVRKVIEEATKGLLKPRPGMTIRESFEASVNGILNKVRDTSGKSAQESLKRDNNVKTMTTAGSKGSFINISQMSAMVGQQNVEGQRIPFGFKHRTLPHFTKDDFSPESRGFVENSYLRGLTPQEFFFHAMAGREGLIDTAVKTAETGYIQRRLVKAMEDVMVAYDGTVRNSLGDVLQWTYGEDGMDGAHVEEQKMSLLTISDKVFQRNFRVDILAGAGAGFSRNALQVGIIDPKKEFDVQKRLDEEFAQLEADRHNLRTFIFPYGPPKRLVMPVPISRIIQNAKAAFEIDRRRPSDLDPVYIIEEVKKLTTRLHIVPGNDALSHRMQEDATLLFQIMLREQLAVRRVIEEHRLQKVAFDFIVGEIEQQFLRARAHPGEMCGVLAAQSIGEPATQMTLNTFHYAGVSSKNVTLGVPRLKEIINVATNLKTPRLKVYLDAEIAISPDSSKAVLTELAHATLRTITKSTEIFYDPEPSTTRIEEDRDFVEAFFSIPDEEVEQKMHLQSPWLLRLELDRAQMLDKKLEMSYVASKISEAFQSDIFVIWSEDNAEKLIIRCRVINNQADKDEAGNVEEDVFLRKLENTMLNSISLRGVDGISRAFMVQDSKTVLSADGDYRTDKGDWMLETEGINLKKVLSVEGVDATRTTTNSLLEAFEVLGIEAARGVLMTEMREVLEFDGSYVNFRHLGLLCDIMTYRGTLMSITRHGINRTDAGALMRCSFEETVEILFEAAAMGEKDDCRGIAQNIMFGQVAPLGTGAFDVYLDMDMLKDVPIDEAITAAEFAMDGGMTPATGSMTPYDRSPSYDGGFRAEAAAFSPLVMAGADETSQFSYRAGLGQSPLGAGLGVASPGYAPSSPTYSPTSPFVPTSPYNAGATSPFITSPLGAGATSPFYAPGRQGAIVTSPTYSPTSPGFQMTSPAYTPTSPAYTPTSPNYSPSSPSFSPTSPNPRARGATGYSPTSPQYSPTSPQYTPTSPQYSPTSPHFSPASPRFSPTSPRYSPTSPMQTSPTSPRYSPTSPARASPQYSPTSPAMMSPASPSYSPASPAYSPTSPTYGGALSPARGSQQNGQSGTPASGYKQAYQSSPSWE
ncbi:beta and beta-prime subunits of DNA dependent RNA-polymerase [Calocera viscosa TUFC12733]|uniref:DNA-directed RNA polymerase subunit n=1 Tax=Calocera viscosa (strain TUFC12733) TaxID=1330018 RepID=A0A167QCJ8_CALVF|nr:beta and beta-prime subunits of DNA dependent RNA-polymerase [Calocera viscosa TUFC12733]